MVATNDEILNEVSAVDVPISEEIKSISDEEFEKAQKTFQLGKKNLFLNKYDESVNNIGDACKIYSNKYGELNPQCAEIYFFYGKALLELARVETTVLGNALNGVPEDNEPINDSRYGNPEDVAADEKKEISEKVIDALCDEKRIEANGETVEATAVTEPVADAPVVDASIPVETEVPAEKIQTTTTTETTTEQTGETAVVESKESDEAAEGEEEDEEIDEDEEAVEDLTKNEEQLKDEAEAEEISNLQRSWEMFELAKLIYTKNFDSDILFKNKRIAECLLKLGEISIEQEFYEQAITDISESIKLQESQKDQERDERMLAESFYQLGLAQQFNNLFNDANDSYQKSINIMQLRVEKLKAKLATLEEATSDADIELEKTTIKDEITELEALLPEMTGKLEEVTEQGQQSLSLIKEAKECFINSISNAPQPTATNGGEVKDITSLVKSKRKISETTTEDNIVKKTRLSDADEIVDANIVKATEETNIEVDEVKTTTTTTEAAETIQTVEATNTVVEPIVEEKIVIDEQKPAEEITPAVVEPIAEAIQTA